MKEVLRDLKKGKMIILMDDEDRENEGDFIVAAEKITPAQINFMATHGRGLICLSMTSAEAKRLAIPLMTTFNESNYGTAFGVTIEAAKGTTTGSSVFDRAHTIRVAADPHSKPADLIRPGHVFPLIAKDGGVFVRQGHTEGSVDLMRLAGCRPQAVICEIMRKDGKMARRPDLRKLAKKYKLPIVSLSEIVSYRTEHDPVMILSARATLPSKFGEFEVCVFQSPHHDKEHAALISKKKNAKAPLVRIHSCCLTGDVFGSLRCDCGYQLDKSMEMIAKEGGILLYLSQEGRGIGLSNKIKAYALQEKDQLDTVEANRRLGFQSDHREYIDAGKILHCLGVESIRLLTNNPEKISALEKAGIKVLERVPLISPVNAYNKFYLETKQKKLGHIF